MESKAFVPFATFAVASKTVSPFAIALNETVAVSYGEEYSIGTLLMKTSHNTRSPINKIASFGSKSLLFAVAGFVFFSSSIFKPLPKT